VASQTVVLAHVLVSAGLDLVLHVLNPSALDGMKHAGRAVAQVAEFSVRPPTEAKKESQPMGEH
jgi:hypothetical protein